MKMKLMVLLALVVALGLVLGSAGCACEKMERAAERASQRADQVK